MSKSAYNYGSSYGGNTASSLYSYRDRVAAAAAAYPYLSDDGAVAAATGRLPSVEPYTPAGDSSYFSDRGSMYFPSSTGAASFYGGSAYESSATAGIKRSVEALYHQSLLGSNNNFGQSEDLFSSNSLIKRTKQNIGSNLPIYPQRPGAKDCAYYMMTRTCKFGDACKFDHPIWVPQFGIPDWKEVPLISTSESLPERPGEPDCPYYMKTQKCKFGANCKFNHPTDKLNAYTVETGVGSQGTGASSDTLLPERPSEAVCSFYMKTGTCKFGSSCKFNHPKDLQLPGKGQDTSMKADTGTVMDNSLTSETLKLKSFVPFTPALVHNSKGLPIRLGETDCPFYLKTGSCKYGPTCRYNHPERHSINPVMATDLVRALVPSSATTLHIAGLLNPAANFLQNIELQSAQTSLGVVPTVYPQRPGEIECDFYMKTGQCKFGERCRFHHPIDRSTQSTVTKQTSQQTVKLSLAGLPRREGATVCSFYMKTGTCKFVAACKFDHPPPGEAIAMATNQGTGGGDGVEAPTTQEGENIIDGQALGM